MFVFTDPIRAPHSARGTFPIITILTKTTSFLAILSHEAVILAPLLAVLCELPTVRILAQVLAL